MPRVGQTIALSAPVLTSNPFWMTPNKVTVKLYLGHVLERLRLLPSNSVHCVITSPPYWGLRDYKTEPILWEDGWLGSYGNEPTPDMFVAHTVSIFREVRRVLRDDGTLWLNLGDSYNGDGNLVGIPWRVALALQADGWILRQDVIWHKPSPMPESVRNRCTKAHEYVFLFAKEKGYFYDAEAVREAPAGYTRKGGKADWTAESGHTNGVGSSSFHQMAPNGANRRDVWTVDKPLMTLRDDLTPEQKTYVVGELIRRGLL